MKEGDICTHCNNGVLLSGKELWITNDGYILEDTPDKDKLICKKCYWSICQFCRKLGIDNHSCINCNKEYCPDCAKQWERLLKDKIENNIYNFDTSIVPFKDSRYNMYPRKDYMYGDHNLCIDCGEDIWKQFKEK
jgi:hypothetical protein